MNGKKASSYLTNSESSYKLYFAAAIGALCLGFGDLLNNDHAATVLKMAEIFRKYIYPGLQSGGIWALVLLVFLGGFVCWLHKPQTRVDAFARGFSVFALLAVTTPYQGVPGGLNSPPQKISHSPMSLFQTDNAYAQGGEANKDKLPEGSASQSDSNQGDQTGVVRVFIEPAQIETVSGATVTVRDATSAEILARARIVGEHFTVTKPVGEYTVEVESPGFRIIVFDLSISDQTKAYNLPMRKSRIPISLQRLVAPETGKLVERSTSPPGLDNPT